MLKSFINVIFIAKRQLYINIFRSLVFFLFHLFLNDDVYVDLKKLDILLLSFKKNNYRMYQSKSRRMFDHSSSQWCALRIENIRIKQVQKFDFLAGVITDNEKYDTEIRRFVGIAKDAFKKPGKVLRRENFVRNNKKKRSELLCHQASSTTKRSRKITLNHFQMFNDFSLRRHYT